MTIVRCAAPQRGIVVHSVRYGAKVGCVGGTRRLEEAFHLSGRDKLILEAREKQDWTRYAGREWRPRTPRRCAGSAAP